MRAFVSLLVIAMLAAGGSSPGARGSAATIDITLLSLAGWNGEVEPSIVDGVPVGGAAELTSRFAAERAAHPNMLVLGTGNAFGTSPPISNLFADEPAVRALNAMGLDADTLGNDNFDHGIAYLQRLMTMSDHPYLAANLVNADANLSGVRRYRIFETGGVRVAVIGVTDADSPSLVFPGNFGTIQVSDPAIAANKAREAAIAEGATVFVLITEMGVTGVNPLSGPLIDLANRVTGFDAVLGSGGSASYTAAINGARVVASQVRGLAYGRTALRVDAATGKVTSSSATFVQPVVTSDPRGAAVAEMVAVYRAQLSARLSAIIATSAVAIGPADVCGQPQGRTCESLVSNVVADAMRAAYGGDIALVNAGGIRAALTCPATDNPADFCPPFQGPPFPITEGQVQAVLPFGNLAVTVSVTGAELKAMLENGVGSFAENSGRFPQVSGFCFWYELARPAGDRVLAAARQAADGTCTGAPIAFSGGERLLMVTNDFIAAGGDGYPRPAATVSPRERLDAVVSRYLAGLRSVSPAAQGRVNCIGQGCPSLLSGVVSALPAGQIRPPSTGDAGLR